MPQPRDLTPFIHQVSALVDAAMKAGADDADAVTVHGQARSVSVRLGEVEGIEASESEDMSLRVFVDGRVASVSANIAADPDILARRAVAMARVSPRDPHQALVEPELLVSAPQDLDLFDPTDVSSEELRETALAMEDTARAMNGITNSGGASASAGSGGLILATSRGFLGHYTRSGFGRSVSVIAGEGTAMERDYDFSHRLHFSDLDDAETIGKRAAERAIKRLGARQIPTGRFPVIFDPRVARGFAGTLAGAINGASVARKTSFLRDKMGEIVANASITLTDDPLRLRSPGSRPFDGEGVAGERLVMIDKGALRHWFLSHSVAGELGLKTNGRGVRSGSSVMPSSTNLAIEPGERSPADLISAVSTGFYVTDVFGPGVDLVTGDYSRGAAGFWIENGALAYPVAEVTIASNMKDMFLSMEPANDIERHFPTASPTLLIGDMTIAGK
ncbi:TldD/PmbA family protein [Limoniibacter endophyticus]|uniref:Modulator protein n=1 Tax=Limoniibacter endophyticus TaxID=1565040 RepID=A0A8J3DHP6_9HYPH|nr:TldD/PmbA family protein [Limoniibacter endophyticus]GHC67934.1 modulator protein [Limoniibacter endophyticus]